VRDTPAAREVGRPKAGDGNGVYNTITKGSTNAPYLISRLHGVAKTLIIPTLCDTSLEV